jgi:diguanylate cyclase (GGDEF)-like protein
LIVSTVIRCRSEKKNFFIFCLIGILLYVGGNFFEVTSSDVGGAFTGVKVMYAGGCFMSPLFLMFILDYCEVVVRLPWRVLMVCVPFINLMFVWTTDTTGLIYTKFRYTSDAMIHGLQIVEQGPLYYLVFAISLVCIAVSVVIIMRRNFVWGSRYRKSLFLLMLISAGPLLANVIYIFGTYILKTDLHGVNFTPYVLVCTSTIFYRSVLRYDLFDFSTRAKSVTVDIIHDAIIFMDMDNNFSSANAVARDLIPSLSEFPKGRPVANAEGWPPELKDITSLDYMKEINLSFDKDSEMRYYKARVKPVEAGGHEIGTVLLMQDATDTVALMKKLENAAYTDALTEIYNRRHFMELSTMLLERAKRAGTPCSMMIFDLDKFKDVNDSYGHLAGDEVLRAVAAKVSESIRSYDVLGRYGGEEFVIFMDGATLGAAERSAERIRKKISSKPIRYADADIRITCSIGVAETPDSSESIECLIERADAALYQAKRDGRDLVRAARTEQTEQTEPTEPTTQTKQSEQ